MFVESTQVSTDFMLVESSPACPEAGSLVLTGQGWDPFHYFPPSECDSKSSLLKGSPSHVPPAALGNKQSCPCRAAGLVAVADGVTSLLSLFPAV